MIKDIKGTQDFELTEEKLVPFIWLRQNRQEEIINLEPSMSATDINNIIENLSKRDIPSSKTLIFQFVDGTYNFDDFIRFYDFRGAGRLYIQGNTSDAQTANSNQKVMLNFTSNYRRGIILYSINVNYCEFKYLRINKQNTGSTNLDENCSLRLSSNTAKLKILYNYFNLENNNYGACIYATQTEAEITACMFNRGYYGLCAAYSSHIRLANSPSDNPSAYGIYQYNNGNISKAGSPYPFGTVANERYGLGTGGIA